MSISVLALIVLLPGCEHEEIICATPEITVSPDVVHAGDRVTVATRGVGLLSCLPPADSMVIHLNLINFTSNTGGDGPQPSNLLPGWAATTVTTSDGGRFSVSGRLPSNLPPGSYTFRIPELPPDIADPFTVT